MIFGAQINDPKCKTNFWTTRNDLILNNMEVHSLITEDTFRIIWLGLRNHAFTYFKYFFIYTEYFGSENTKLLKRYQLNQNPKKTQKIR